MTTPAQAANAVDQLANGIAVPTITPPSSLDRFTSKVGDVVGSTLEGLASLFIAKEAAKIQARQKVQEDAPAAPPPSSVTATTGDIGFVARNKDILIFGGIAFAAVAGLAVVLKD